jgi:hypothetical protein
VNQWLDGNADGIALALVLGVIGLVILLGAIFIERLVEPRHEREFDHLTRAARARREQATRYVPPRLERQDFTPSAGWLADR